MSARQRMVLWQRPSIKLTRFFVRGSGIRYRLSAEHSATRRPLGQNSGLYLFDNIEFEIID